MGLFEDIEKHRNDIFVMLKELEVVVPQHTHSQGHILVVLNSVATMDIGHSTYYIPYGYFIWIPPGVSHRVSFDDKKIHVLNIYYPKGSTADRFYSQVGVYPIPSLLYHTFELVQGQSAVYAPGDWHHELMMTILNILPHILEENAYKLRLPTASSPAVKKVLKKIHRQYGNPISAQSISEESGISVRTLSRHFKSELGMSFVQYLRSYRIMMAIKQMSKHEETITDIAYSVGYESITAFSNSFFKVTGCRPSCFFSHYDKERPQ